MVGMASLFVLLQHASLLAALAVLSPVRCGSVISPPSSTYQKPGVIAIMTYVFATG